MNASAPGSFRMDTPQRSRPLPTPERQVRTAQRIAGRQHPWSECQRCGACCRHLIVEVGHEDVAREPRIAERGILLDGHGKLKAEEWCWSLTGVLGSRVCPFLTCDNLCEIYATRPLCCAAFMPGSDLCRKVRKMDKQEGRIRNK